MAKNRILFALWLALWGFVWLLSGESMAFWLLLASVASAAVEIGLVFAVRHRVCVTLEAALSCHKDEPLTVTLIGKNTGHMSCAAVQAEIRCRNLLTGEEDTRILQMAVPGGGVCRMPCRFTPRRCGKLRIECVRLRGLDAFGLVALPIPTAASAAALVMPEIYPVDIRLSERKSPDADSDAYSMYFPGEDPSETFALREYVPGDRIRSIHWKLSEKTDRLTVRQLGLPVDDSVLLVLDSGAEDPCTPALREALGEAWICVSAALCGQGVPHRLSRWERESGEFVYYSVSDTEELTQTLSELLSAEIGTQEGVPPLPENAEAEYARVVLVTLRPELTELESGTVTVLTVSSENPGGEEGLYLAL